MIPVQLIAQKSERSIFTSLKISEMSLTILSYMHVLCRRADLVKKHFSRCNHSHILCMCSKAL